MSNEFNFLKRNADIVYRTGKKSFRGSICLSSELMMAVVELEDDTAEVIDASDLTTAPGFGIISSHADG